MKIREDPGSSLFISVTAGGNKACSKHDKRHRPYNFNGAALDSSIYQNSRGYSNKIAQQVQPVYSSDL